MVCPNADGNSCTEEICNPATGACDSTMALSGVDCSGDDICTTGNVCESGVCGSGVSVAMVGVVGSEGVGAKSPN